MLIYGGRMPIVLARVLLIGLLGLGVLSAGWATLPPVAVAQSPEAEEVSTGRMVIDRRGGLSLYGQPFLSKPEMSVFTPRTLTLSLPKGMSLLAGKVKACSKAKVRKARSRDALNSCSVFGAGRLGGGEAFTGWYAVAGPKKGDKRLVWMRAKNGWQVLTSFGTGVIERASGAYSTKLVLRFGELNFQTSGVEVQIGSLREDRECPSAGWRLKIEVEAAEGADSIARRAACRGGGGGGSGGRP
jgi:hypothetical protein